MAGLNHPLENVRVIDLGRHQAGPRCAQVLARMGAEVIKVESLGGEETRYHGPWVKKQSSYWVQYNSGKKSLSIDLRKEEGKEVLRELVKVSDILVQNFRPGTIENMGFGYETLKELNPRIIMVNVSAYGQFGPYRDNIGYDPIGQTMSGITMVTGEEGYAADKDGGAHHRPHHRPARGHRRAGGAERAGGVRRGPGHGRVPGGYRLLHDRNPHHRLSRDEDTAPPGRHHGPALGHLSLQGGLGAGVGRRPAPLAPGLQRPGPARLGWKTRGSTRSHERAANRELGGRGHAGGSGGQDAWSRR